MAFNKNSLKERAMEINNNGGVPFMEGREKADSLPLQEVVTIDNFGFLKGEDGEYIVLSLREYPQVFFFGGSVITDKMKNFDNETDREEIEFNGLPVMFEKKPNKKGRREYFTCEFFPEDVQA